MVNKFSTLLAGAALLGAVSAQAGAPVKTVDSKGLYQLAVEKIAADKATTADSKLLALDKDGKLIVVKNSDITAAPEKLATTLWCVSVTPEAYGKAPVYNFVNKATGMRLDMAYAGTALNNAEPAADDVKKADAEAVVGGEIYDWAFSATYKDAMNPATLYAYFSGDSVVGLKLDGDKLYWGKTSAKVAQADAQAGDKFSVFTLVEADSVVLNAQTLNTIFGQQKEDKGVKLTFNPDKNNTSLKNYFTDDAKFFAEKSSEDKWLNVLVGSKANKEYLYVDTSYVNDNGTKFLAFATKKLKANETIDAVLKGYKDQAKFRFVYYPAKDSLVIQVKEVTHTKDGKNKRFYIADNAYKVTLDAEGKVTSAAPGDVKDEHDKANYVTVQDLVSADKIRIVTIATKKETEIGLGLSGCGSYTSDKTTVADGVYLIKNVTTGKYLAYPIHHNGQPEWVTLDLQDPNHMPAYQWVVLKDNKTDVNNVSPIKAWNREFNHLPAMPGLQGQLTKVEKGLSLASAGVVKTGDVLEFVPVDKKYYSDKYLGYKLLTDDDLKVNKFLFNYWHPYAADKYISVLKDNSMKVMDGKTAFTITTSKCEHPYGYRVADEIGGEKGRIPGLVTLVRKAYQISYNDAIFAHNDQADENKYLLVKGDAAKADSVYFKENNCIVRAEGEAASHYYAILEAKDENNERGANIIGDFKAGVSDYDANASLKVQPIHETRTSAFFIAPDNTPLYRRFNNELLGESKTDSTVFLKFKESIRGEYLMDEHNPELTNAKVNYAGIWNEAKANGNLAFRVDTAWVNRGSGNVKPQYLLSAFRTLVEGEKVIPCTEDEHHITADGKPTSDPCACVHAKHVKTPAFYYGKFLVNFSDSAKANPSEKGNPYIFNTKAVSNSSYTRVGFVPAIQYNDTIIFLTGKYRNMTAEQLKNVGVETILSEYRANNDLKGFVQDLSGDVHKNYTWSFRYVNPDKAAAAYTTGEEGADNAFLIESNVYKDNETYQTVGRGTADKAIAPIEKAAWLKMHNGCLVLTDVRSEFNAAKTGGDGALVFNAYVKGENDNTVTKNEEVAVENVTVIAGNGSVTVLGAAGKNVIISNILGQVVANTVLTSDNATIAVPAGIVAVAVDGEKAVKAIVK